MTKNDRKSRVIKTEQGRVINYTFLSDASVIRGLAASCGKHIKLSQALAQVAKLKQVASNYEKEKLHTHQ